MQTLRDLYARMTSEEPESAREFFILRGVPPEKQRDIYSRLLRNREISAKGVELLAGGAFGPLMDVFPGREAEQWSARAGVPMEECWALHRAGAQVALHWDGKRFRVFRLDDVGKIEARLKAK